MARRKLLKSRSARFAWRYVLVPLGRRCWRHRAGLLPFWWALAFLVVGWVGAAFWPAWWPVPGLAGSGVAALLWFNGPRMSSRAQRLWMWLVPDSLDDGKPGVLDRATERGYLAVLLAGGGAWLSAAMQFGCITAVQLALVGLLVVLGFPWWWHRGWRRKKPLNVFARRWAKVETDDDLKPWHGSTVVSAVTAANTTLLTVKLRGSRTIMHVGGDALSLCASLGLRPGAITVAQDPDAARRVLVRIVPRDPWTSPIPHPVPALRSRSLEDDRKVILGRYEDDTDCLVKLEQHWLTVGASGSGKSELLQSLVAWILSYRHATLLAADLAGGATFDVWEDVLAAPLATDVESAFDLLRKVFTLIEHRERKLTALRRSGEKINVLPVTAEEPAVFLFLDEFPDLVNGAKMTEGKDGRPLDVMTILERIAKKARKVRVWLILAAQNPGVADVGSTTLRAQLTATVGLGLDQQQSKTLWGTLRAQGWDSEPLSQGSYLLRDRNDPDHQTPRVAKGLWLSPSERSLLIEKASRMPGIFSGREAEIVGVPTRPVIDPAGVAVIDPPAKGEKPQLRLVRETSEPPAGNPVGIPRGSRSAELDEKVFAEIPDAHQGGIGGTEIAAQLGVSRDRVKRSFQRLEKVGRIRSTGDGSWVRA